MHPFRRLVVWKKAHELSLRVYRVTASFNDRMYPGLPSQMRRAAFSVAYNIAEGAGRETPAQFARALEIALGSAHELDYQLLLAKDLGALGIADHATLEARVGEVNRMLAGLRKTVLLRPDRRRTNSRKKRFDQQTLNRSD